MSGIKPELAVEGSSKGSNTTPEKVEHKKRKNVPGNVHDVRPLRTMDPQGRIVNKDVTCYECGKKSHRRDQCYRLKGGCFRCGEMSHKIADYREFSEQGYHLQGIMCYHRD